MAWTPFFLMLLSYCTGSLSQPVLTQPPSVSVSLGATARLTCTLSSGFNVGDFWIRWYLQNPGSPPRYLLTFHSDSDKHQGSGVPSRFSGSNDASVNAGILLISGLQPEDEADYYCATWHGNSKAFTVLQIQREVRQKPLHRSALFTKEAQEFPPPAPALSRLSDLHRQSLIDFPQSRYRDS
ncbi:PREDICTED: immunoglobulin iota chain-like [Miniopterus natalensis]|uniref:immunoglobulin iota chain-like n=1 Tax=Miniopterus natalensis TaxID=291302 RepID=UPI0007A6B676|nr:PREDICTED: immunoglobulin iota chain-like [Miniopterus natalensis]